jgi:hypothetical protein
MWTSAAPILTGICLFLAAPPRAEDKTAAVRLQGAKKGRAALEQKLLGVWQGRIGCDGRLVIRADGTYALTEFGPGSDDSAGTWKLRRDTRPATLVLTCTSEDPNEPAKRQKVRLIKLDDRSLAIRYTSRYVGHYTRVKK